MKAQKIKGLKNLTSAIRVNFSLLTLNFSLKYTGLSGITKLIRRKSAAGTVSAQNIQRQPHSTFHT